MQSLCFRRFKETPWRSVAFVAAGLYACSFQDFGYLKEGDGGSGGGPAAVTAGTGGTGLQETQAGSSGLVDAGGQGGALEPAGGSGGEGGSLDAGSGGDVLDSGGSGGAPEESAGSGGTAGTAGMEGPPPQRELVNASFEQYLTGWLIDPTQAASPQPCPDSSNNKAYVFVEAPNDGGMVPQGNLVLKTWHKCNEYEISVFQRRSGLEPGSYTLKGHFSSTQSRGAYLFARSCESPEEELQQQIVIPCNNSGTGNAWDFGEWVLSGVQVPEGGCIEVGFHLHNIGEDWLNADAFSFTRDETSEPE